MPLFILMIILFWFTIWMAVRHYYVFSREKRELLEHISDVTYTDVFEKKQKEKSTRTAYSEANQICGRFFGFRTESQLF